VKTAFRAYYSASKKLWEIDNMYKPPKTKANTQKLWFCCFGTAKLLNLLEKLQ